MSTKTISNKKFDWLGISSSSLCLLHCLLAPFVLTLHPVLNFLNLESEYYEYLFILMGIVAVYFSAKKSVSTRLNNWLWTMLVIFATGIILHEQYHPFIYVSYLGSLGLVIIHYLKLKE